MMMVCVHGMETLVDWEPRHVTVSRIWCAACMRAWSIWYRMNAESKDTQQAVAAIKKDINAI